MSVSRFTALCRGWLQRKFVKKSLARFASRLSRTQGRCPPRCWPSGASAPRKMRRRISTLVPPRPLSPPTLPPPLSRPLSHLNLCPLLVLECPIPLCSLSPLMTGTWVSTSPPSPSGTSFRPRVLSLLRISFWMSLISRRASLCHQRLSSLRPSTLGPRKHSDLDRDYHHFYIPQTLMPLLVFIYLLS